MFCFKLGKRQKKLTKRSKFIKMKPSHQRVFINGLSVNGRRPPRWPAENYTQTGKHRKSSAACRKRSLSDKANDCGGRGNWLRKCSPRTHRGFGKTKALFTIMLGHTPLWLYGSSWLRMEL
ncbi:hypothetical protein TNCV_4060541 [Trichonephila clavipes]|nr:hypothetical protein TNCV_4060541 [Trichonephila clavipes]